MKIDSVALRAIKQPLVAPFVTSFGPQEDKEALIVTVHANGLSGWGECVASREPGYSYETTATAWHILQDFLIPAIVQWQFDEPWQLAERLRFVRGHPLAKAALDQALWDLAAQRDGLSLAQKLAEPYEEGPRARVAVGVSVGIQAGIAQTIDVVQGYLDQGYGRIKLKIKPGYDAALARAARAAFPQTPLMLDANSAYTLQDAALFRQLDDLKLLMLEQPLGYEDIYDHSRLRPQIQTPLCLDESIHSADHARYALAIGACDIINIKPARVGGWSEARRVHDLCRQAQIPVWCGGMLETGIGRAAQLALASLPGFSLPGDISATDRYFHRDITAPFFLNREDSTITVPTAPGLGVEIDHKQLQKVTVSEMRF